MPRPPFIELGDGRHAVRMPILHEDRSVIAIDKPEGWMLVPFNWQRTHYNLHAAITSSIAAGDFWARSRNLKYLRHIHRLDAETTGILLFARSPGALDMFSDLFEARKIEKTYLAVVHGAPSESEWECALKLGPDARHIGRMRVDEHEGKEAETFFRKVETRGKFSLIEAYPITGRTHQIRVHLRETGYPIVGDTLYGPPGKLGDLMALRSVEMAYRDPFSHRPVRIVAPRDEFLRAHGFAPEKAARPKAAAVKPGVRRR